MNPIKSPQELIMEQAGLPHYAGGHSVSPEQMKVELMINGHKVHQADLPHDHPLIQHFAGGSAVAPAPGMMDMLWSKIKEHAPSALGHGITFGLPAYDVAEKLHEGNVGGARESALEAAIGLMPLPVQAGWMALKPTELNAGEDEQMKAIHRMQDEMIKNGYYKK
jgi:hypothetical protein